MALTIANREETIVGNKRLVSGTLAFDTSYPTGGEALTPRDLGLQKVDYLLLHQTKGVVFEYDYAAEKVLAYVPGIEVDAAGALTLDDFPTTAGKLATAVTVGFETGAGAGVKRFGTMKEVASTADMSAVTGVRFLVFGS